ncbi:MAG: hypothetical protein A3G49_01700 [Candidatus Sungbacteria bacterium RIFCSPLOWO2_12_FULL_41_11]|uniref:Adenylate kinase n=1 Tax=Candidatus Sungbacteria bacterium RIFCSPLOWO2_12_FULL_41_11 TaxID=1802286 RepID=A0A1G2LQY6_9BACT|nr:MAG: Adenylate kinase [Parcubacteria group bacterium GW2011_GWA2_42_14]OGZ98410.1 MAG: hypothetical protein A3D41_01550 [Candidatus Sungbacteria bacterium RIFCSPHIGHO2_02_FULL_41_12b]OHA13934.1 MAG: hypothetical protein A3G49_01700 [Candidatus Sungbacteria bacterium RIFCSPLOWO2_12_FULL_41_11]
MPKVVIFFGLPGSGKGTQADVLAKHFGFFHFDTGKEIEKTVHNPAKRKDPVIKREAKFFDTGFLNTPSWVEDIVKKRTEEYAEAGRNLVFSGSPRTLPEAKGLFKVFKKLFGLKNVLIIFLDIDEETSIFRNSHRRVCHDCRIPVIWSKETKDLTHCPYCGGKLVKRILDNPQIIKERIKEYRKKSEPSMKFLKSKGIKMICIDGEKYPEVVSKDIASHFNK